MLLTVTAGLTLTGCAGSKVMYLDPGTTQTVQLRKTVKGWPVWIKDSTGVKVPAKADLLEGGFYRPHLH